MYVSKSLGESGMSLIEVLAAMVVLTLGVLGLAPMMAISIDGSVSSDNITSLVASAQEQIEAKLAEGITGPMPVTEINSAGDGMYSITTVVTDATIDTLVPDRVYKVDVSVNWYENGVNRSLGFVTYTAKP